VHTDLYLKTVTVTINKGSNIPLLFLYYYYAALNALDVNQEDELQVPSLSTQ